MASASGDGRLIPKFRPGKGTEYSNLSKQQSELLGEAPRDMGESKRFRRFNYNLYNAVRTRRPPQNVKNENPEKSKTTMLQEEVDNNTTLNNKTKSNPEAHPDVTEARPKETNVEIKSDIGNEGQYISSSNRTELEPNESSNNIDKTGANDMDKTSWMTLTTVNLFLSICCIVLSILMSYNIMTSSSHRSLVQALYLRNGLTDFFVGIGVLLQCPILYLMVWKEREISDVYIPVYLTYVITAVAVKMSVFMNCVLGTVRCINILQPFYRINRKALTMSTLLYMSVWIILTGVDLWQFTEKRGTDNEFFLVKTFVVKGLPGFGLTLMITNEEEYGSSYLSYHLVNVVKFLLPTALPSLLCFILMIVQVNYLLRQKAAKKISEKKSSVAMTPQGKESKASLTIFLLTCIYVGTSAVSILTWLIVSGSKGYLGSKSRYEELIKEGRTMVSWSDLTAMYFALSTCPLICSTLTPLTLLLRGSGPASTNITSLWKRHLLSRTLSDLLSKVRSQMSFNNASNVSNDNPSLP